MIFFFFNYHKQNSGILMQVKNVGGTCKGNPGKKNTFDRDFRISRTCKGNQGPAWVLAHIAICELTSLEEK